MDKIEKIKSAITPIISLTEEELYMFSNFFEVKKLKKNEFFLKEGQVCDFIGKLSFKNYEKMDKSIFEMNSILNIWIFIKSIIILINPKYKQITFFFL